MRTDVRYVAIADLMVDNLKRLGRKTSAGWYDYSTDGRSSESLAVNELILQASRDAGVTRKSFSTDEIIERITLAKTAEAISILDEHIADRPRDIDLVLIHGYGYPRWRGGLMHAADKTGLAHIAERIAAFAKTDPLSWKVPALLQRMVQDRKSFESLNGK
jgi:3-hydroxyacyl-CoA dehydrogenase